MRNTTEKSGKKIQWNKFSDRQSGFVCNKRDVYVGHCSLLISFLHWIWMPRINNSTKKGGKGRPLCEMKYFRKRRDLRYGNLFTASGFILFILRFFLCFRFNLFTTGTARIGISLSWSFLLCFWNLRRSNSPEIQYFPPFRRKNTDIFAQLFSGLRKPFLAKMDYSKAGKQLLQINVVVVLLLVFGFFLASKHIWKRDRCVVSMRCRHVFFEILFFRRHQ